MQFAALSFVAADTPALPSDDTLSDEEDEIDELKPGVFAASDDEHHIEDVERFTTPAARIAFHSLQFIPPLNINVLIVGSRGDVQPFIALGKGLQEFGHRVRISTHECFRDFVKGNGIDFFPLAGDPKELMSFIVKHPHMVTVDRQAISQQHDTMRDIFASCWRSCCETEGTHVPYVPDVLISNPPVQVHCHIAEKLQIPLQIHFTMPWSPTSAYPHPMAPLQALLSNKKSYTSMERLMWVGMMGLINNLRKTLDLSPLTLTTGGATVRHERTPHLYCMSPSLVPRPKDWARHLQMTGFWFLELEEGSFTPPPDLAEFLEDQSAPVIYAGFGSIDGVDAVQLSTTVINAVLQAGVRAVISKGWLDLGNIPLPPQVKLIGPCPHEWLFPKCHAVVHHGGAGTTACGARHGVPTVVVPFFGDQTFWGNVLHDAGMAPVPIPHKNLTAENLAAGIKWCLTPEARERAHQVGEQIRQENGVVTACQLFHEFLPFDRDGQWICHSFEYQRRYPPKGWTSTLLRTDRASWSTLRGWVQLPKDGFTLPAGWEWTTEWAPVIAPSTDQEGWQYGGQRFPGSDWKPEPPTFGLVRRRLWTRRRRYIAITPGTQIVDASHALKASYIEVQRYWPGKGWTHPLATDRITFSDFAGGQNRPDTPPRPGYVWDGDWSVDKSVQGDEDGWQYAINITTTFRPKKSMMCTVRRRRLVRPMRLPQEDEAK